MTLDKLLTLFCPRHRAVPLVNERWRSADGKVTVRFVDVGTGTCAASTTSREDTGSSRRENAAATVWWYTTTGSSVARPRSTDSRSTSCGCTTKTPTTGRLAVTLVTLHNRPRLPTDQPHYVRDSQHVSRLRSVMLAALHVGFLAVLYKT